tara:strand:- start:5663 stop:6037 length:375 start_codon:yes stop_codon:yes gene_type:complete
MKDNRTKTRNRAFRIMHKVNALCIIVSVIFSICTQSSFAQQKIESKRKIRQKNKKITDKREEDRAAEINISEDLRKLHISNQNKQVRKRMKKNKKRAKRYNDNKKKFFLFRWFKEVELKIRMLF